MLYAKTYRLENLRSKYYSILYSFIIQVFMLFDFEVYKHNMPSYILV